MMKSDIKEIDIFYFFIFFIYYSVPYSYSQDFVFDDIEFETESSENWIFVNDINIDPFSNTITYTDGDKILVGDFRNDSAPGKIFANMKSNSGYIDFHFMVYPNAKGYIGLPGGLGISLSDDLLTENVDSCVTGTIIVPEGYEGVNRIGFLGDVSNSFIAGVWQHLTIQFSTEIENNSIAFRIEKVNLNGRDIQNNITLSNFKNKVPSNVDFESNSKNEISFVINSGGLIAFKNIKVMAFEELRDSERKEIDITEFNMDGTRSNQKKLVPAIPPMIIRNSNKTTSQRSFLFVDDKKYLTCINVGFPEMVNYSYDLETGTLLQVWRGEFGEVSSMRYGRGVDQVFKPLGIARRTDFKSSFFCVSENEESSIIDLKRLGYHLEHNVPVYRYSSKYLEILDKFTVNNDFPAIDRDIAVSIKEFDGDINNEIFFRIALSENIKEVSERLFLINNDIFIKLNSNNAIVEFNNDGIKELIVPLDSDLTENEIKYTIFW